MTHMSPYPFIPFTKKEDHDDAVLAYQTAEQSQLSTKDNGIDPLEKELDLLAKEEGILTRIGKDLTNFTMHGEMLTAPVHGYIKGWNELLKSTDSALNWQSDRTNLPLNPYLQVLDKEGKFDLELFSQRPEGQQLAQIPNISPPESGTGHLVSGVAQFLSDLGPMMKALKPHKVFS